MIFGKNFEDDVKIDKFHLDTMCQEQPELFYLYAERLARKNDEIEEVKNLISFTEGMKDLHYRKSPPDGLKPTEATYTSLMKQDTELVELNTRLRILTLEKNTLDAAVKSLQQRNGQIDNLVKLQLAKYYDADGGRDRLNN